MKKIVLLFALIFAFSGVCFAAEKIDVYYFYAKPRCITCQKIENYTKSAVDGLKDSSISYKTVDMDKAENKPLVKKYKLFTKSVILSKTNDGKEQWKNLDKIFLKVKNEADFKKYIQDEIISFKGVK